MRFLLLLPLVAGFIAVGCLPNTMRPINNGGVNPLAGKPTVESLVGYLNQNAAKVQNLRAAVQIDCSADRQSVELSGHLACQKPLDFRLKANVVGKPAIDLGSNSSEFWYWISMDKPPYVYHCSHADYSKGRVRLPFPFQPDMVIAALGIGEYDPNGKYKLETTKEAIELHQDTVGPTGQPIRRVTGFNNMKVTAGRPLILGHKLLDSKGKLVCKATVQTVTVDRETQAVLPSVVTIEYPEQKLSMKLMMSNITTNCLTKDRVPVLFSRTDLSQLDSFDMARGVVDGASTLRQAGVPGSGVTTPR
jgi:hypothetical protein